MCRALGCPQLGFPASGFSRSSSESPRVGWALRLASPSIAVPGVTTSASLASQSSGFYSIFQHIDPSCEHHLEDSPDSHPENIYRQKQCLGRDAESQVSVTLLEAETAAFGALLQCPLGLGMERLLLVVILWQLRFHVQKDGVQFWLLSCINAQDNLVSIGSQTKKKNGSCGSPVPDGRAVCVPMKAL